MGERRLDDETIDLRGLRCPLNWARAKVWLESRASGSSAVLWIDDPKGVRDIPAAAEAEGWSVLQVDAFGGGWKIVIVV